MKLDKLKYELKWEDIVKEGLNWFNIWTSLCKSDASLKSKQFHLKMLHRYDLCHYSVYVCIAFLVMNESVIFAFLL